MKKEVKIIGIVAIILVIILAVVIAVLVTRNDRGTILAGEYVIEISFNEGDAETVTMFFRGINEPEAREAEEETRRLFAVNQIDGIVERDGTKITITLSFAEFVYFYEWEEEMTREEIIRRFQEEDYVVFERETGDSGTIMAMFIEAYEITFRRGRVNRVIVTHNFFNEVRAENIGAEIREELSADIRFEIRNNNIGTIDMNVRDFNLFRSEILFRGADFFRENLTREEVIETLEEAGYVVIR
ncbi:MAG: hypothetical protein FWC79_00030 [Oscillospiraceae bacterium]|nr:hypothetical protein [Oscillospiraceae bacterium]